jgi:hypothetical protein
MIMSHFITLKTAKEMTSIYRLQRETILDPIFQNRDILATCETFDRAAFDAVLGQQDCVQLRIYYGMDIDLQIHAIIVGVGRDGEDLLPEDPDAPNTQIIDLGTRCPAVCPATPM